MVEPILRSPEAGHVNGNDPVYGRTDGPSRTQKGSPRRPSPADTVQEQRRRF
jgi:hypothetical protein